MSLARRDWSAEIYAANARFVSDHGAPVLELLAPEPGERILDLGCGDGALTEKLAAAGADVLGVDASPDMIRAAAARALNVRQMDGQRLELPDASFDAVFSNAALHWMPDGAAVIAGVHRVLKPGGRFVAEMGGHGNVAAIETAIRAVMPRYGIDPAMLKRWYPSDAHYGAMLRSAGFRVEYAALIPRRTPLPTGILGWLATFVEPLVPGLDASARQAAMAEMEALLAPSLQVEDGSWVADYVRLRFRAVK